MKIKKRSAISLFSSIIGLLCSSIAVSFAWFVGKANIDVENYLNASVIATYFHCGTGAETDPFIITRPKHWENLVWLHNNIDGFDTANFYFEIGCSSDRLSDPTGFTYADDTGPKYVFDYSDSGYCSGANSTTLNVKALEDPLLPLGSPTKPFNGSIAGNGLCVSNFTILSYLDTDSDGEKDSGETGLSDIGIFGYVGENGKCSNTYFTDFVIDISGSDASNIPASDSGHDTFNDNLGKHVTNTSNIGYLAGHIAKSENFENVYINNCELKGSTTTSQATKSVYGYYGKVDVDNGSSTSSKGYHYNINFDSTTFYNYFNDNWDENYNLESSVIRTRDSVDSTYFTNKNITFGGSGWGNSGKDNKIAVHQSTAIIGGFLRPNYELMGGYAGNNPYGTYPSMNGDDSGTTNFSLSTLGFENLGNKATRNSTYEVYSLKDSTLSLDNLNTKLGTSTIENLVNDGTLSIPLSGTSVTTTPLEKVYDEKDTTYFYYQSDGSDSSNSKWVYYGTDNSADYTSVKFNIYFSDTSSTTISETIGLNYSTVFSSISGALYIDNISAIDLNFSKSESTTWGGQKVTCTIGNNSVVRTLGVGKHYAAVVFNLTSSKDGVKHRFGYYGSASNSIISPLEFTVSSSTSTITIDLPVSYDSELFSSGISILDDRSSYAFDITTGSPKYGNNKFKENIVAYNGSTEKFEFLTINNESDVINDVTFNKSVIFSYNTSSTSGKKENCWYADVSEDYSPDSQKGFIGDDADVIESGYNYKNIDIVGGGVTFSRDYCTLVAELNSGVSSLVTTAVPDADVDSNCKFYATKYCPNSIVMYIKNLYNSSGDMGQIEFNYDMAVGQYLNYTAKEPSFKKGRDDTYYDSVDECFVDFTELEEDTEHISGSTDGDERTETIILKRDSIEKLSFCGIDEDGYIVAKYANLFDGSGNITGTKLIGDSSKIDRYVLVLGVVKTSTSSTNINTRITSIDFSFTAEGYGGTFGTVDFRDLVNTNDADTTIFSFIFVTDADKKYSFSIKVNFIRETSYRTYNVVASVDSGSADLAISFYLYDTTQETMPYRMRINGEYIYDSSYGVTLTPSSG